MICDVCNSPVPEGEGRQVPAQEFRQWLVAGFEPDEATIELLLQGGEERSTAISMWATHCAAMDTDWSLCGGCLGRAPLVHGTSSSHAATGAPPGLVKNVLEERCLSGSGSWVIHFIGAQANDQTSLGIGWLADWESDGQVIPTTFSRETAARLLQVIYTAFTALHDPASYFRQIDPSELTSESDRPEYVIVGSVRESGSLQFVARWDTTPYVAEVMIYPDGGGRGPTAILEKGSIARIGLTIEKIFEALGWPKPG